MQIALSVRPTCITNARPVLRNLSRSAQVSRAATILPLWVLSLTHYLLVTQAAEKLGAPTYVFSPLSREFLLWSSRRGLRSSTFVSKYFSRIIKRLMGDENDGRWTMMESGWWSADADLSKLFRGWLSSRGWFWEV